MCSIGRSSRPGRALRPRRAAQRRRLVTREQRGKALLRQPKCQASATRAQAGLGCAASPMAPGAQWARARRVAAWRRRLPVKRHLLSRPLRAARAPCDAANTVAARGGCGAAVLAQRPARCGAVHARRDASAKTRDFRTGPSRGAPPHMVCPALPTYVRAAAAERGAAAAAAACHKRNDDIPLAACNTHPDSPSASRESALTTHEFDSLAAIVWAGPSWHKLVPGPPLKNWGWVQASRHVRKNVRGPPHWGPARRPLNKVLRGRVYQHNR